jgi:outer membrane protein assembly factor BamB
VTGYSFDPNTSYDYATVAYDAASGTQRWVARYNGPGNGDDVAYGLAVSRGGATVFVTGYTSRSNSSKDYATVAYDAATGTQRWAARYKGPGNGDDVPYAVAVGGGGASVFLTGYSAGSNTSFDYATVAYDAASGTRRWVARYDGPGNGNDGAFALAVSLDGVAVVTGYDWSGTSFDYATVAYDAANGAQRWVARYNGPGNIDDIATAVGAAPDGATLFVTGYSAGSNTSFDAATVAYDAANGAQRWVARYNGPGNGDDGMYALGVGRHGRTVFVTGYSSGSNASFDYATVAYDAVSGTQRRVAKTGPGSATALGISPEGTALFVTGSVGTPISDYGTIAYSLIP